MSKGGLSAELVESAKWIIEKLERQPESIDFLNPVDYVGLNLMDYPEVITQPMDLGTVMVKLDEGLYLDITEFMADLKLIWENCKTYNAADSLIVSRAKKLERIAQKWYMQYLNDSSEDTESELPVTFEELVDLAEAIRRCDHETCREVVHEIESELPTARRDFNPDQTLISLNGISRELFDRLKTLTYKNKSC